MSWDESYDQGYYEGIRNAVTELIQLNMQGWTVLDIIKHLAVLRAAALEEWQEHDEDDEDEDS